MPKIYWTVVRLTILSLSCLSCAESPQPAIWLIEDNDTKIYISGDIHVLSSDTSWSYKEYENILNKADEVILEIVKPDVDILNQMVAMYGRYPRGQSLQDDISTETYSLFSEKLYEVTGIKRNKVLMKPWYAVFYYGAKLAQKQEKSPNYSLGNYVRAEAIRSNIQIIGLETPESQVLVFNAVSQAYPNQLIRAVLFEGDDTFDDSWANGDVKKMAVYLDEYIHRFPDFSKFVIVERNKTWVDKIVKKMEDPGVKLIVVGMGHLVGQSSVLDLLNEQGIQVQRVH